jgi:hypothetical protein
MSFLSIILIVFFSAVVCISEIPKMVRDKEKKELTAFLIILFIGAGASILQSLEIKIPNPAEFIAKIYSPVVDLMKGVLE